MCRHIAKCGVLISLVTLFCMVSWAQDYNYQVDYFPNLGSWDGQKTVVNDGYYGSGHAGNVCDLIYVFHDEQLQECCGCVVTPDGSRDFDINKSFNSNNLTGSAQPNLVIKQVGAFTGYETDADTTTVTVSPTAGVSFPGGSCDPTIALTTAATKLGLHGWAVKTQVIGSSSGITETPSQNASLSQAELTSLSANCASAVADLGTGKGICTCGSFD